MKNVTAYLEKYFYDESVFRLVYIMSLFLSCLSFVEYGFSFLTGITMAWAAFLLQNRIRGLNSQRMFRFFGIAVLFLVCSLITTLMYYKENFGANLLMFYHAIICFFLLYGMHTEENRRKIQKEMDNVTKILSIITMIFAAAGLMVFLIFVRVEGFSYCIGLKGNRFTGLYTHPNIAAFTSTIGILCTHISYKKKQISKGIGIGSFVLNFLTILLADSNSSLSFLLIYLFLYMWLRHWTKNRAISIQKTVSIFIFIAVLAGLLFSARSGCQKGMAAFVNIIHPTEMSEESKVQSADILYEQEDISIGRGERKDLSSGRMDSLQKALLLFERNPWMGIGKGNILDFGERYLEEGFRYFDLHNGYLTILVSQGVIGFSLIILFFIGIVKKTFQLFNRYVCFKSGKQEESFPILVALLGAYSIFAFFERALLLDVTFMVGIFWLFLGYLMSYLVIYEEEPVSVRYGFLSEGIIRRLS